MGGREVFFFDGGKKGWERLNVGRGSGGGWGGWEGGGRCGMGWGGGGVVVGRVQIPQGIFQMSVYLTVKAML